ncbi:TlpA family protein disulfide reductase [Brumimicrobium sp.]|uniref:TlpA family protein disulfide reductase n=1 Tax=Brumimicrobium sp. TaxID=2029867 RepID=UPI003A8E71CE
MKKSIYVLALSTLFLACGSEDETTKPQTESVETSAKEDSGKMIKDPNATPNVSINGTVNNGGNATLLLEANTDRGPILISKTVTNADGSFQLDGAIEAMGLYQLRVDEVVQQGQEPKVIPLTLVPEDELTLQLDFNEFNRSVVYEGTNWAAPLNGYMAEMRKFVDWQMTLVNPQQYPQEELIEMVMEKKEPMDRYIVKEIKKDPGNPAHILLMTNLMPMMGFENYDMKNIEVLKTLHKAYEEKYPEHPMTVSIGSQVAQLEQSLNDYVDYKEKNIAPEITKVNPDGEEMKLSSLRGKYVLIDFWASWCGPCRVENPNVVRLYNKYKGDKFEIFSVSLDKDKEKWMKAIEADGLIWDYHVSDLQGWETDVVQKYQFNGIPHTVLIDPEGKIIAEKLRGPSLEKKLQELFGK